MVKVAIVGSSHINEDEKELVKNECYTIIKKYDKPIIISGGAKGVDTIAITLARSLGCETQVFNPKKPTWAEFSKRNLQIAKECDEIYCVTTQIKTQKCYHHDPPRSHERTGACWTMNKAIDQGKIGKVIVVN